MTEKNTDTEALKKIHEQAMADFKVAEAHESDNRKEAKDDIEFACLGKQWDEALKAQRLKEGRPCLTLNKLKPFIRQVVNDARQNKPSIKVSPQDSVADPETADIMSGLIRNIETSSDADACFDTALECAATSGWGYIRINLDYATDDSWDQDIVFKRVPNPFSIYGDPNSEAVDSSDWNTAFVVESMTKEEFKRRFPKAEHTDFAAADMPASWQPEGRVMVAEYWVREEVAKLLYQLDNGTTLLPTDDQEQQLEKLAEQGIHPFGEPREIKTHKVTQYVLNGVEVLEKRDWPGKYIPIIPVYGEEVNVNGKRFFRSLIRDAKDAQVMYNSWRTASTELVAMAPKVPFIGPKGSFNSDDRWETANSVSHSYIEYDVVPGGSPPQRQPMDSMPAGTLQEALNASDDMKAIIGIYDASLGARSNETSGRAIMARQREGDVSTFHFIDNLSRAIRHCGRILIDLIPKVYPEDRVVRTLGEQGDVNLAQIGTPEQAQASMMAAQQASEEQRANIERIYSLTAGKYDLTVSTGPSFTTRREEAAMQMTELIRAYPAAAPVLGDLLAKNLDWPGADEIANRLQKMQGGGDNEQMQALMQQVEGLTQMIQQLKADKSIEDRKVSVDEFEAETDRMKAVVDATKPSRLPRPY